MLLRIALMLLIASASLPLLAAEGRQAPGREGCPVAEEDPTNPRPAAERLPAGPAEAVERGTGGRGGPEGGARMPRWHSFLPGMFR
ncbi:hypothetical protein E4582_11590 [Luteimonas yindakuii]|uniref:Uncharacterized protein n=1 Tax=Luteimonas yindakuii TaxID=2565782 RepID=A0A4Z1R044_9GAMM|nr:hypothetical protein [Luteimonas yindakuii]TKS52872.1 hypothetical protein E4582_11590 [Luteimonas yindakuii]